MASTPQLAIWIVDSLRLGGAERLAIQCAAAPPPGWDIRLVGLQPPPNSASVASLWGDELLPIEGRWLQLGMRRLADPVEFARLLALLRRQRPVLVHSHLRYAHIWSAAACRLLRLPHLATVHVMPGAGPRAESPGAARRMAQLEKLERYALRGAARRIYVSETQRRAWTRALPLESARQRFRTVVIPNGCRSAPPWTPAQRMAWRRGQGLGEGPVVLTVAVVRREKGWQDWLETIARIGAQCPAAQFVWVGAGPDLPAFHAACARHPLRGRMHLPGTRSDVADWLRGADVFLFPSHGEAQPTAVMEAMAQALPVAATGLAANREVLGETGRFAPPHCPDQLAEAALPWCLGPQASAQRLLAGRAAQQRWRERFAPETWAARLAESYEKAGSGEWRAETGAHPLPTPPAPILTPSPHRILMVEFFDRGGLLHYGWQLAQALAAAGAEVAVLTGRHPESGIRGGAPGGIEPGARLLPRLWMWNPHHRPRLVPRGLLRAVRGLRYLVVWWQVLRIVRFWRPGTVLFGDLEHRCDAWFVRRLRHSGRAGGPRLADIWHNVEPFERGRAGRLVRRAPWRPRMARDFDAVFVHGAALAAQLRQLTGVEAIEIPHGNQAWIERQAGPDPDLDRRFSLPPGRVTALVFGTLSPYKGIDDLLAALARLPAARRPLCVIAGMPAAAARPAAWRERVRATGVAPWLRWDQRYVPTPEVAWYFRRADFVILPYRAASQSGVAHLAMTFAKPLIVTATGSLPELIDGNGLVVAPAAPDALARAIDQLAGNRRLRLRMGRRAAELSATRHDWNRIGARVLEALGENPRPAGASAG